MRSRLLWLPLGLVLLVLLAPARVETQSLEWARRAGGANFDQGTSIAVDTAGNAYVTGHFTGDATFGPGQPNETTLTSLGADIFVAKYDSTGSLLWVRQANGAPDARAEAIAVDAAGNSYVTGLYRFGLTFDASTTLPEIGPGVPDLFVAKYDSNGMFLWARAGGVDLVAGSGAAGKHGRAIAVDDAGNSHVTGHIGNSSGGADAFVAKYDASGVLLWAKDASEEGSSGGGISVDVAGNTYVTGRSEGSADQPVDLVVNGSFESPQLSPNSFQVFEVVPGWTQVSGFTGMELQHHVAGSPFHGDQFLELDSFTPTGVAQEVPTQPGRSYTLSFAFSPRPGTVDIDNVLRVTWGGEQVALVSADGSVLAETEWRIYTFPVIGGPGTSTTLTFEDLGVSNTLGTYVDAVSVIDHAPGAAGLFLAKFDSSGMVQWVRRVAGDVRGEALSLDVGGNPHIAGGFAGSVVFGAGEANETTLAATGIEDIFVARYDSGGSVVWAKQSSGARLKEALGIAVDSAGNSYVAGRFDISMTFGAGETTLTTGSLFGEAFVAAYDASGAALWARQTIGPYLARAEGIAVGSGAIYIAGTFGNVAGNAGDATSVVFGSGEANATVLTTAPGSGTEIFVARFAIEVAANRPPIADPQEVSTPEDTPVSITLTASDPDGDTLSFRIV
jgi:hypothetical protein